MSNTCSLCNRSYVWPADLKRHLKTKHDQQKSTLKQPYTPEQQQRPYTSEQQRPYTPEQQQRPYTFTPEQQILFLIHQHAYQKSTHSNQTFLQC